MISVDHKRDTLHKAHLKYLLALSQLLNLKMYILQPMDGNGDFYKNDELTVDGYIDNYTTPRGEIITKLTLSNVSFLNDKTI